MPPNAQCPPPCGAQLWELDWHLGGGDGQEEGLEELSLSYQVTVLGVLQYFLQGLLESQRSPLTPPSTCQRNPEGSSEYKSDQATILLKPTRRKTGGGGRRQGVDFPRNTNISRGPFRETTRFNQQAKEVESSTILSDKLRTKKKRKETFPVSMFESKFPGFVYTVYHLPWGCIPPFFGSSACFEVIAPFLMFCPQKPATRSWPLLPEKCLHVGVSF